MRGSHDPVLVVASILLAFLAAWTALELARRGAARSGRARRRQIGAAALATGFGLWSTQLVAMLAFRLPVPIEYNVPLCIIALLAALGGSAWMFARVDRGPVEAEPVEPVAVGAGIAFVTMHYAALAGVRVPGQLRYEPTAVVAAGAVAMLAATLMLRLMLRFGVRHPRHPAVQRIGYAVPLGLALVAVQFTVIGGLRFVPTGEMRYVDELLLLRTRALPYQVGFGAMLVLVGTLAAPRWTRRLRPAGSHAAPGETYFRAVVEQAAELVSVVDAAGRILYASPATDRMLGYPAAELVGHEILDCIHPADVPRMIAALDRATLDPSWEFVVQARVRHRDGSWRTLASTGQNLLEHPQIAGLVLRSRDVTEQSEPARNPHFDPRPTRSAAYDWDASGAATKTA